MAARRRAVVDDLGGNIMIPLSGRLKDRRRTLIIVSGIAAVLLAVGGYVLWSGASWSSYRESYSSWKREAKTGVDAALNLPNTTTKQRADKLQAFTNKAVALTNSAEAQCKPNGMVGWQESINGTYKQWRQECEADAAAMAALNGQLAAASAYLKSEHTLASALSVALAATDSKVNEKSFSTVLTKWKTASAAVKSLEAPPAFMPVKAKAQKTVDNVTVAWQALVKAHAAKNEADYNKAVQALSGAYSSIDGIETASANEFAKLATALQVSYTSTF